MRDLKRHYWILAILLLLLPASANKALAWRGDPFSRIRVEILSDHRGTLTKYPAEFSDKLSTRSYVAVENEERYRIRVYNGSGERVGLVIAVDGRNIISGVKSYLSPAERMYILAPHETQEFEGWRTGQNRVHRFYFTGMSDSYAAAWGDYSAMGVIAVAVFEGRSNSPIRRDNKKGARPAPPGAMFHRDSPGTGFGEGEWSPSRTVSFSPREKPVAREFIKYEYRRTLCRKEIINCRENNRPPRKNRFWGSFFPEDGFAPFPPGFRIK